MQALKRRKLAASTTNRVLKHLKAILAAARSWGLLERIVDIARVKEPDKHPAFYDFADYRRLTRAAASLELEHLVGARLGGDAGLRCGEVLGLRWPNVHLRRGKLYICDNLVRTLDNRWQLRTPKGGTPRWVPISKPLHSALRKLERRGDHVLTDASGQHLTRSAFMHLLNTAQKRAGLEPSGSHVLRHTFCSHLVLRGVHVRTIQKLAGHAKLSTTEVYLHLVSEVEDEAIRRLRDEEDE